MKDLYISPICDEAALEVGSLLAVSLSGNEPFNTIPGGLFDE